MQLGADGGPKSTVSRRSVVAGGAAVAVTVACGANACASGNAPTAAQPTGTGGAVGAAGTPLGPASEIPVGGGKIFTSLEVVVTQPRAGEFLGFSAECTHTGCIVNEIAGGTINCPCHGSRYNLDGTVASGPAPRALPRRPVAESNGQVVLT